jgi:hypothetical protein
MRRCSNSPQSNHRDIPAFCFRSASGRELGRTLPVRQQRAQEVQASNQADRETHRPDVADTRFRLDGRANERVRDLVEEPYEEKTHSGSAR